MIKVKGTAKLFRPEEDLEVPILARVADHLSPEVTAITVDDDGLITKVSTDPEEDDTPYVAYHSFSTVESLHGCQTIQYSKLQELDRLGPFVDLSLYYDESQTAQKVTFKFDVTGKPRNSRMMWDELHLYKSLPRHPNIVPFDRVVLTDTGSRVIGFKYIPGGTFDNLERPFRFEYLQQLIQLVDYLNLDLGIMHQDIAPRNLLVDPQTQKLLVFDFNWAAHGKAGLLDGRDDVMGVAFALYELITGDDQFQFSKIPHWERNIDMVQGISDWPCKRELDADVSVFRNFLNEWVATRRGNNDMERYLNAPNRLTWPDQPDPPDYLEPVEFGKNEDGSTRWRTGFWSRRTAIQKGWYVFRWERPPQCRLGKSAEETRESEETCERK